MTATPINLAGKVALVTGAGSVTDEALGMGAVMALALHRAGAVVAALDINGKGLARLCTGLRSQGGERLMTVQADLASPGDCERAVASVTARIGAPHIVVNLAGVGQPGAAPSGRTTPYHFWEADPDGWLRVQAINSGGPFLLTRLLVPAMLDRGWGRIVNISTSFETMLDPYRSAYGPSKAALESSSAIWARELEGSGVTVNCLLPGGMVATNAPGLRGAPRDEMLDANIMAAPICWLASDLSDGVSGRRFVARLWEPRDPAAHAQPIGWPGIGPGRTAPIPGF